MKQLGIVEMVFFEEIFLEIYISRNLFDRFFSKNAPITILTNISRFFHQLSESLQFFLKIYIS